MAQNYKYSGERLDYTNSGSAIASGVPVKVGAGAGIALVDIAATTGTGALAMAGVWELPLTDGSIPAVGTPMYWDGTGCTATAASGFYVGNVFSPTAAASSVEIVLPEVQRQAAVVAAITPSNYSAIAGTYADLAAARTSVAAFAAEAETRDDAQDAKINAILTALKAAGIMASA